MSKGDVKKVSSAITELEKEEAKSKTHMPPGKYQVIYADLTNQNSESELAQLQVGEIAESSSVLFLWVTPSGLERGLKLAQHWGFVYKTCLVWNKEFLLDVTNNAEILLISAKGSPAMIFKESEPYRNGNKPQVIRERIQATYLGSKIDLFFDDSLTGWMFW
jgi:N6-adenosine-specific RNA methylase IME4